MGDRVGQVTQAVAENIKVLAVDQSADDQADKPAVARALTIEATPAQASLITLAQSVGNLSLSLRNVDDAAPLARKVVTSAQLGAFNGGAPVSAPAATTRVRRAAAGPPANEVHVARGVNISTYSVTSH